MLEALPPALRTQGVEHELAVRADERPAVAAGEKPQAGQVGRARAAPAQRADLQGGGHVGERAHLEVESEPCS